MNRYEEAIAYLKDQRSKLHIRHEGCALSEETIVDHEKKRELLNLIIDCVSYCNIQAEFQNEKKEEIKTDDNIE